MDEPKSPWGLSIAGALVAFIAVFFAFPLAMTAAVGPDTGLVNLINMGGSGAYLVLLAAGAGAFGQAVLIVVAARGAPKAAALLPLLGTLVFALGVFGFKNGMHGALEAIAHVAPADKTSITFAALSEATCCIILGASFAAALWLGQAFGLGISGSGAGGAVRVGLVVPAAAALGCGLWAGAAAFVAGGSAFAFATRARVMETDPEILIDHAAALVARWETLSLGLAAAGALAAVAAAGWGMMRARPAAAFAAVLSGLAALCLLGMHVSRHQTDGDVAHALQEQEASAPDLMVFAGKPAFVGSWVEVDAQGPHLEEGVTPGELLERGRRFSQVDHRERLTLAVRVKKGTTPAAMAELARMAVSTGFEQLALLGRPPPPAARAWPSSLQALSIVDPRDAVLPLELACDDAKTSARLTPDGVMLGKKLLPFTAHRPGDEDPEYDAVLDEMPPLSAEDLVRVITTLRHAGYRTVFTVPEPPRPQ